MRRKRNQPDHSPYRTASGSFFIAFFAYTCAALARLSDESVSDRGGITPVLLVLGVVNLCLSLIYGRTGKPDGKTRRRPAKRTDRRRVWRS